MLPFNLFSLHDLIGLMITAPLAVIFYLLYFKLGRRKLDALFGNLMTCGAVGCLVMFLEDNLVPAGVPSWQVPHGPERTLLIFQIQFTVGWLGIAALLHFVSHYCGRDRIGPLRVEWVYAIAIALLPLVWTPWFMTVRREPLAQTSSWFCVLPYMPHSGSLYWAFFATWAAGGVWAVCLLWRYQRQLTGQGGGVFTAARLVLLAVAFPAISVAVDMGVAVTGMHASVAVAPIGFTIAGVIMASALLRERIRSERDKQLLGRELALAAEIQRCLLPEQPPQIDGFELAGWSQPANATGGDTYDFMVLPDQQVMVTLGDASGHGMGPALVITEARAILRAFALSLRDPAMILRDARQLLVMDLPTNRLITCFVGILDPGAGTLTYAAAGQGPILVYRKETDEFETSPATGPPLSPGLPAEIGASLESLRLGHGDFVVLASDGFYEAPNPAREQLSAQRLIAALHAARRGSLEDIIAASRSAVTTFCEGVPQEDDMTIVLLRKT
jgi:serine phosphatase RsbU (regulator of sigma subunit)